VDLNGDGYQDILSGSYSHMSQPMAGVFQVLWGQDDGTFKKAEVLTGTDDKPLIISAQESDDPSQSTLEVICTRPMAVDWDADGDLDLIVGNFGGSFYLFVGEGEGQFQPASQPILSNGKLLKVVSQHSDPFVVDWDQDGDLDLLSGSAQGGVQWAENSAGAGKLPVLGPFQSLIAAGSKNHNAPLLKESDLTGPASSTRIWVEDINSDGKLDILVGDNTTLISPAQGLSEQQYKEKHAAWTKKFQEASEAYSASMQQGTTEDDDQESETGGFTGWMKSLVGLGPPSDMESAQEKYMEVYQQQSEFMQSESTGFVWLYLQE